MINMKLENKSQPQKFASRQPKLFRLKKMKINEFHTQTQLNQSRINMITDVDNLLKKFNDSHLQDYLGKKSFTMKLVISPTFKTFLLKYYGHIILRFFKKVQYTYFLRSQIFILHTLFEASIYRPLLLPFTATYEQWAQLSFYYLFIAISTHITIGNSVV